MFKSQYLSEFLIYAPDFLHVTMTFVGLKITFSNMGSYGIFSLIYGGWSGGQNDHPPHLAENLKHHP